MRCLWEITYRCFIALRYPLLDIVMLFFYIREVKKVRKKLLSFCLAMAMIVSTTPSLAFAANSAQTDNPTKVEQKVGDVSEVKSN